MSDPAPTTVHVAGGERAPAADAQSSNVTVTKQHAATFSAHGEGYSTEEVDNHGNSTEVEYNWKSTEAENHDITISDRTAKSLEPE